MGITIYCVENIMVCNLHKKKKKKKKAIFFMIYIITITHIEDHPNFEDHYPCFESSHGPMAKVLSKLLFYIIIATVFANSIVKKMQTSRTKL